MDSFFVPPLMVYRIQNKNGNGVYRPGKNKKTPYAKNEVIDALDDMTRVYGGFRFTPFLSDLITNDELKSFKAGDYVSGFSSLAQLVGWFPFRGELEIFNEYGFKVYRVYAKKIISFENQCMFMPTGKISKCSEEVTEDMISDDEVNLMNCIREDRIKRMKLLIKRNKEYDDEMKTKVLKLING